MFRFLLNTVLVSFLLSISAILSIAVYLQHSYPSHNNSIPDTKKDMVIHFINFHIGRYTLIQIGQEGILFDVGDQADHMELMDYLKSQGIQEITKVFLTNWTKENTSGVISLLSSFPDAQVYIPQVTDRNYNLPPNLSLYKIQIGDHIFLSKQSNISLDILAPIAPVFQNAYNDSMVSLLHYQKINVLLTSAIREEAEQQLLQKYPSLKAEIMTVPVRPTGVLHSKNFIKTINPQTSVMFEMPCNQCKNIVQDAANRYSQEWSDFFFIPIGKTLKITFDHGAYTTPKNQMDP